MYWEDVYKTFVALRDQFYRCKTQKELDKYSNIEALQYKYITFKRFCNACEEYFWWRYIDEVTDETVQDVFDKCLTYSQQKCLKLTLIWY